MLMSGHRTLLWVVLLCAMMLPLAAQAKVNAAPLAGPATGYLLSAQKCHMAGCACPCCQHTSNQGNKSGCRCISLSFLPGLPSAVDAAPVPHESPNYAVFIVSAPRTIVADIFRPPQS
jgi:hypothetical protein